MERRGAIEVHLMADNSDVVEALRRLVSTEMDTVNTACRVQSLVITPEG